MRVPFLLLSQNPLFADHTNFTFSFPLPEREPTQLIIAVMVFVAVFFKFSVLASLLCSESLKSIMVMLGSWPVCLERQRLVAGNQLHVLFAIFTSINITGTSTNTPTTVANAAPDCRPKSEIATATDNSKKLLAPIIPAGAAISWGNFHHFAQP